VLLLTKLQQGLTLGWLDIYPLLAGFNLSLLFL
jgi:hypothetical protein